MWQTQMIHEGTTEHKLCNANQAFAKNEAFDHHPGRLTARMSSTPTSIAPLWKPLPIRMKTLLPALALSLLAFAWPACHSAGADATPSRIEWSDLQPKRTPPADNPFASLTDADRADLRLLARERDGSRLGIPLSDAAKAETTAAAKRLQDRKIDAAKLLAERERLARERELQTKGAVQELSGKPVMLAGYMLPLDYKGDKVSEFLLVPWVGACIHTPPPPPNQIVHVKPAEPVEAKGSFAPVWISGTLVVQAGRRSLQMSDGSAPVDSGYSMSGAAVRPYEKP
jgi:hypothetical protein